MKKLFIGGILFLIILFLVLKGGIQIGNVTIGHKLESLKMNQSSLIEKSSIYQKYLNTDKLIVLNYWATWCKPCVGEIPSLNQVKSKYEGKKIEFLSFSIDSDSLKLARFINANKFKFADVTFENLKYKNAVQNFLENRPLDESIGIQSVPITYIIKNKKVLKKFDGSVNAQELISEIDKAVRN